ncbi:hypothetical protein LOK49_LG10G02261 [Camellia lanceoleosa]|uniref:Uncharacterized protein n=1 Tax=Camellia lanceoleosa TaxID=1840588 RepID=A0ACC0GCD5_9ERIC|nr:hypothetical protein LOK49_LG10G02261 [Camellia lanceoleosa]
MVFPFNVTDQETLEIFNTTSLTRQFNRRVREFFSDDDKYYKVKFFMTWISLSSSFGHREFISMESLFIANPHGCLMILSKTMDSNRRLRILKLLLDHGFRVLATEPDLPFLFKDIRSLKPRFNLGSIESKAVNKIPVKSIGSKSV